MFGVDFMHVPIDEGQHEGRAAAKAAQEAAIQATLDDAGVDLVVLARYMQVGALLGRRCARDSSRQPSPGRGLEHEDA